MKTTSLSIATIIGAATLWSGAVLASDYSVVSEAVPAQQEEMKSEGQSTKSDTQAAEPTAVEPNQEAGQAQPETPVPSQDQTPSDGDQPKN
ncbi:hypothetical protein [Petrachloros mirabilis]